MDNNDTIHLLQECDAGTKMAVNSIDETLEKVQDDKLRTILNAHVASVCNQIRYGFIAFIHSQHDIRLYPGHALRHQIWVLIRAAMLCEKGMNLIFRRLRQSVLLL